MSDTKTEWRARQSWPGIADRAAVWEVVQFVRGAHGDKQVRFVAMGLDKPTAHKIAAVNELEAALIRAHEKMLAIADCIEELNIHAEQTGWDIPAILVRDEASFMEAALAKSRGET